MRVGFVIGQIEKAGGMEKQAILLARSFRDRGIYSTVFISGLKQGRISDGVDLSGIEYKYLYYNKFTPFISRLLLRYYCNKNNLSHLIAFHVNNAEIALDARTNCKVIYNVRSIRFSAYDNLRDKYRDISKRSDHLFTNSSNTAELLVEHGITSGDRVDVIHNAISLPDNKLADTGNMILYVGSIKKVKDPMTFIKACHHVIDRISDTKVVMVGKGPMRPDIENYIRMNNLNDHFTLSGELPFDQIPFEKSSVFVNSSLRESSSNSILEALSFGLPVVASDNPGNRDILGNLDHHRLVPVSDSRGMGDAIIELLNLDNEKRQDLFRRSREFIARSYSISEISDKYIEALKNI